MRKIRILVVDDETAIRDLLMEFLALEGYRVAGAVDGKDALIILSRGVPDLVVSDINMPNMNGLELLRATRQDETFKNIPFILMSGKISDDMEACPAGYFLSKPFNLDDLRKLVNEVLSESAPLS